MDRPRICAVLVDGDAKAAKEAEPLADLFEVRIDLIGDGWPELVRHLSKPWIACNRTASEGGQWPGNEARRIEGLLQAAELGAAIVDVELSTKNLEKIVPMVKKRAKCLLSFHNLEETPPFDKMREIVRRQLKAGADICKVVTTARSLEDSLTVLRLIAEFPETRITAFAMGAPGSVSRVLCPLVGGDFTYASTAPGRESAQGQIAVSELRKIYEMIRS